MKHLKLHLKKIALLAAVTTIGIASLLMNTGLLLENASAAATSTSHELPTLYKTINPDNWIIEQYLLDRAGNLAIQLQLFYDYGSNLPLYPKWQAYFSEHQPPTLVVWGKNDQIFPAEGAHPYKRDLKNLDFHLLDTGHFALEEDLNVIADHIKRFMTKHVVRKPTAKK